jgi:intracellular multiplication protein IcmM
MSRENWRLIAQSKRFYVNTFRRAGNALLVSILMNLLLGVAIQVVYFNQPENDFYATNGATSPVTLTAMESPNNASAAMLASDPDNESDIRVIPQ